MRVAAQERRQELSRRGRVDLPDALPEREGHELARRPVGQPVEAVLHADELQFRPRLVVVGREKEMSVAERLAQAGGGDDLEGQLQPRTAPAVGGRRMQLRHNACAERAELDRRAVVPRTAAAGAPLRQPGEQAAVVVQEGAARPVLVGEQQRQEIAEPAQQYLVVGGKKLGPVRRLVAEAAHLERNCASPP